MGLYMYKDKANPKQITITNNDKLKNNPNLKMMNKTPLIYNYLEPYENFFNSYSLLYIISNNDPHIKCYKQMELLETNQKFIKSID